MNSAIRTRRPCVSSIGATFLVAIFVGAFTSAAEIDFNRDVRPILSDKCFFCHGPDREERQADLRLDVHEGAEGAFALRGDDKDHAAIVPGDPFKSLVVARITDPDDPMPPEDSHKKMSAEEIATLKQWIEQGAEYDPAWAYLPPVKHPIPAAHRHWPDANGVDRFVNRRLRDAIRTPEKPSDPVTLVRRLYFDLTGLPPTPADVQGYLDDKDENRYENLVERLLASPRFGERMASYWLDLVRYADTVGYHGDQDHNASLYRDYVIRAFNENLPFDQFTREQLAGDLIENPTKWQRIASGYNRLLQTSHEGGIQRKEYLTIYAADRVRNVSNVWMGATVGCAQCHDHKYDPYTIEDFYSLAAFFADLHDEKFTGNSNPTVRPPEERFFTDAQQSEIDAIDKRMDGILPGEKREKLAAATERLKKIEKSLMISELKKGEETVGAAKQKLIEEKATLTKKRDALANQEQRKVLAKLMAERNGIASKKRITMITMAKPPMVTRVLPRGDWLDDSGPIVQPAIPAFHGKIKARMPSGDRADRLDLANWLIDLEDGSGSLTARVFANRMWYLFFGSGISKSLDDFGGQGVAPVNPKLLDHLAIYFYENDWDVKKLVRYIVGTHAYRQSSDRSGFFRNRDPHNQWADHQSISRLPAEMIRDQALFVSGLLVERVGGDSIRPYQPTGYYRHLNHPARVYKHDSDEDQYRRAVYMHWQRQFLHPMLRAFDAPSREECTAERPQSNTPIAALVLLNDPSFVEASRAFAARILAEAPDKSDSSRIAFAFEQATSRKPSEKESMVLVDLLQVATKEYADDAGLAEQLNKNGLWQPPANLDGTELAIWTTIARTILNLDETITRN